VVRPSKGAWSSPLISARRQDIPWLLLVNTSKPTEVLVEATSTGPTANTAGSPTTPPVVSMTCASYRSSPMVVQTKNCDLATGRSGDAEVGSRPSTAIRSPSASSPYGERISTSSGGWSGSSAARQVRPPSWDTTVALDKKLTAVEAEIRALVKRTRPANEHLRGRAGHHRHDPRRGR
jgi:hypothetical protein